MLCLQEEAMMPVGTQNEATRVAWVEQALKQVPPGWRLLDAGAGEQQYRKFCSHLRYVSQDFAQYDPSKTSSGLQMPAWDYGRLDIVSDITRIPEPDASFDAVLCAEVLEHIPDPLLAIREFARLLRPGGILILTAPFCSMTHFAPYHFSTGFSRFFYEHHFPRSGLELVELTPNGNYFEYIAQELRRVPEMAARYAPQVGVLQRWRFFFAGRLLRLMARLSKADSGSAELLCFGYHLRARRQ